MITRRIKISNAVHIFLDVLKQSKNAEQKKNMFLELAPECDPRNSSIKEIMFIEIHCTYIVMLMLCLREVAQQRAKP